MDEEHKKIEQAKLIINAKVNEIISTEEARKSLNALGFLKLNK